MLKAIAVGGGTARTGSHGSRRPTPSSPPASLSAQGPGTLQWRVAEKAQLEPLGGRPGFLLPGFFQTPLRRPGHRPMPPGMSCLADSSCARMRRPQRPLPEVTGVDADLLLLRSWAGALQMKGTACTPAASIWALTVSAEWRHCQQGPSVNFQARPDPGERRGFWHPGSPAAAAGCPAGWSEAWGQLAPVALF